MRPDEAFLSKIHTWRADGYDRKVRQLRPELTGFEMVVVSSNNSAVENITHEIPGEKAIDPPWRGHADYFAEIATGVLLEGRHDDASPETNENEHQQTQLNPINGERDANFGEGKGLGAWGLVAARLGNKRNRNNFRSAFWFDKQSKPSEGQEQHAIPRMQTRLQQWRKNVEPYRPWDEARNQFKLAQRRVDQLLARRFAAAKRAADVARLTDEEHTLSVRVQELQTSLDEAKQNVFEYEPTREQAAAKVAEAQMRHDRHVSVRPGVFETLFSLGRASREWCAQLAPLAAGLDSMEEWQREAELYAEEIQEPVGSLEAERGHLLQELHAVSEKLAQLRQDCLQDRLEFGSSYPGEDRSPEERELRTPWLDPKLDRARSELFLAALQLHQDFIANAASDMEHGLRAACEVIAGIHPPDLEPEKQLAAWQLFFLVVPLVSTTFASVARMFDGIGPHSLGWMLVDEAGQATPQSAVGAIWRAQRVVAVGDPLQLQPVVTVPEKVQLDIATTYGVAPRWTPSRASVQVLADRVSRYGASLRQGEDDVWVGAPLRVHRRCDDPMFSLCNQIAYDGMMVDGVNRSGSNTCFDGPDGPQVLPSAWFDEPVSEAGTHLQRNQIQRFEKLLTKLAELGIEPKEIIAISPFREVADKLDSLRRKYPDLTAGTIHRAQGREARVVVLVLGGDPDKPGAKQWASSTVNLVNVAASRAQRRLYVIGDRSSWSQYNYFHQLAAALR